MRISGGAARTILGSPWWRTGVVAVMAHAASNSLAWLDWEETGGESASPGSSTPKSKSGATTSDIPARPKPEVVTEGVPKTSMPARTTSTSTAPQPEQEATPPASTPLPRPHPERIRRVMTQSGVLSPGADKPSTGPIPRHTRNPHRPHRLERRVSVLVSKRITMERLPGKEFLAAHPWWPPLC